MDLKVNLEQPSEQREGGGGVGRLLRTQRLRLGQEIGFVAEQLRIRPAYLVAIEEARFHELPGSTYAIGFVRAYAEYLGLAAADIVQQFKQESGGGLGNRPELVFPSPVSEGRIPGGAVLFLALILAAMAYGGWYYTSSRDTSIADLVPPLPERLRALVHGEAPIPAGDPSVAAAPGEGEVVPPVEHEAEPAPAPAEETAEAAPEAEVAAAPEPVAETPAVETPVVIAEPEVVAEPEPEPEPAPAAVAEAPAAPPAPPAAATELPPPAPETAAVAGARVYGQENAGSRILLRATDDSWVQVRDAGNAVLLMRLLRRGDVYHVPDRSGLTLMTGSAGALQIEVDGRLAPPLGAIGVVRRDVPLDPDRLLGVN